jgi:exodeoxyribonuclease-5
VSKLTRDQLAAFEFCESILLNHPTHREGALGGYAGTGKTFLVRALVKSLAQRGKRVLVCAPTHKALAQLASEIPAGVTLSTLSAALGQRVVDDDNGETSSVGFSPSTLPTFDVVIIDECSMVCEKDFHKTNATKGAARLLWVGDPAQLPPVGEKTSPVWQYVSAQVVLKKIVRQAEGCDIIRTSLRIREAIDKKERLTLKELLSARILGAESNVSFFKGGATTVADLVVSATEEGLDTMAVSWTNVAVNSIASIVRARMKGPDGDRYQRGDSFFLGRHYRNDKVTVQNNATGRVLDCSEVFLDEGSGLRAHWVRVAMQAAGEPVELTLKVPADPDKFEALRAGLANKQRELATRWKEKGDFSAHQGLGLVKKKSLLLRNTFADLRDRFSITAHKAQGSTVDVCIVNWKDCNKNKNTQEFLRLLYVAVTRPSKYLVIVGG